MLWEKYNIHEVKPSVLMQLTNWCKIAPYKKEVALLNILWGLHWSYWCTIISRVTLGCIGKNRPMSYYRFCWCKGIPRDWLSLHAFWLVWYLSMQNEHVFWHSLSRSYKGILGEGSDICTIQETKHQYCNYDITLKWHPEESKYTSSC